jgi:histidinol-phosphate aminotransferase
VSPLAVPGIAALPRYAPGAAVAGLNLSDNTNLWGMPPAAARVVGEYAASGSSYPSLYGEPLKDAAAAYCGVSAESVITGCGSDNVLHAAMVAFAGPGRRVAYCAPTFVMVPVFARMSGAEPVELPFLPDGDIDADALLAADADVTYLCAPNNPTGSQPSPAAIRRVLERARGLVVVDEAYAEFAGTSVMDQVGNHERLLVARTFSKAFGMAGLRAGFGVAAPGVIAALERARGPFTLNLLAERAAVAALAEDVPWVQARAAEAVANRERLDAELRALGYAPRPSAANFLCVPVADAPGMAVALASHGLLVRAFRQLPGVGDALRITVGPWTTMQRLLEALHAIA